VEEDDWDSEDQEAARIALNRKRCFPITLTKRDRLFR
jgi:hypothetical protein